MVNPDRIAFTIFGHSIYWYGVLMAIGIILAIYLAMMEAKRKSIDEDTMLDLFIVLILCGVVGARLYYVVFEWKSFFGPGIPWWRPFAVWEGGLAIYGAVIAGMLGMYIYGKKKKLFFPILADIVAPGLVLAQSIGRWGNFFNQEAFGLPVTDPGMLWFPLSVKIDVPWNFGIHYFNGELCELPYHMATFFYESLWCLLVFLFLWFFLRKRAKHSGDVFLWYTLCYSFERMFLEGMRGDSLWLIKDAVRVSQALSFVLFIGVLAFMLVRHFKEKKLGVLIWPAPVKAIQESELTEGDAAENSVDAEETAKTGEPAREAEPTVEPTEELQKEDVEPLLPDAIPPEENERGQEVGDDV